ncbi:uncharacterized protein [Drosophila bipectinata]|uniref:uncharacterized protein n=1 Tax=Drosophila bipectinata TaxID=42026 RepID=UPI0038B35498
MTQAGVEAFAKLKEAMCQAPVLHSPDFTKAIFIHCHASSHGIGGVLVQKTEGDGGDEYPIAFVSRKLSKAQKNYSVTEKECLAAIICINRFRPYVEGHRFTVDTDHASLQWLMSQPDLRSRLDHHTKFVFLRAVKKLLADTVVRFIRQELFHMFGVPETVVSDNRTQFKGEAFRGLMRENLVTQVFTAVYSPQANASERVNRSVIAAIRSYVKPNQKNWDEQLTEISCALSTAVHSGIGASRYYLVFGQQYSGSGGSYKLLRPLGLLEDRSVMLSREDSLDVVRSQAQKALEMQGKRNQRRYDTRAREIEFQEAFRRNFTQSNFATGYSAKLGPKYVKARIRKRTGKATYELKDRQGRFIGVYSYHAKDLRQ